MDSPSSAVAESTTTINVPVKHFIPRLPPSNLTRWQRFCAFMKTPEAGLVPMGMMVVGSHIFVGYYLFSEDFLDDFEDDPDAHRWIKKMIVINKSWRSKFEEIRENFSAFKG